MRTPKEILQLFQSRMAHLGISQQELGMRAFGKADNSAIQALKRGASPGYDRVAAMADVLGLELYLGMPRLDTSATFSLAEDGSASDLSKVEALRAGYLPIPWHDASRKKDLAPLAFSHSWLHDNALLPDRLRLVVPDLIEAPGMGLEGIVVLVDVNANRRQAFGTWCYLEDSMTRVANISFDRGITAILAMDAKSKPRLILDSENTKAIILGRVVWLGHVT